MTNSSDDTNMKANSKISRFFTIRNGLIAVLLCIVFLEVSLRLVWGFGSPVLFVTDPELEYMCKPNQDLVRLGNHQFYNSFGMRSAELGKQRLSPSELRILVVGDSIINGGNLTDQSDLATELLKKRLQETWPDKSVVVGNISAGSWEPANQLAYLKKYGMFDADIVLVVASTHDLVDLPTSSKMNPSTHPVEKPFCAISEVVFRYVPRLLPSLSSAPPKDKALLPDIQSGETALRDLLQHCLSETPKVGVLHHYERDEIDSTTSNTMAVRLSQICTELGVPPQSTREAFKKAIEEGQNPFRDYIHPNDLGQLLLSSLMEQKVYEVQNSERNSDDLK